MNETEIKKRPRSKCKACGSSGVIKAACGNGHYSYKNGMNMINLGPGESCVCPRCKPDKYPITNV